jgi:hypothetical protein
VKGLYNGNYKTLITEIEEDTHHHNMEKHPMFTDGKKSILLKCLSYPNRSTNSI